MIDSASDRAVTALVLGILGVVCCGLVAPVAWYVGQCELAAIRTGRAPLRGEGLAIAGRILGMVGTALLALSLLGAAAVFLSAISMQSLHLR